MRFKQEDQGVPLEQEVQVVQVMRLLQGEHLAQEVQGVVHAGGSGAL